MRKAATKIFSKSNHPKFRFHALQQKTGSQPPLTTHNKYDALSQYSHAQTYFRDENKNKFESLVWQHNERNKEIQHNQSHNKEDGWQTARKKKKRPQFWHNRNEKGGEIQQQKSYYSKTRYAREPKFNPNPNLIKPEKPRVVSEANSIPLGRIKEIGSKIKSPLAPKKQNYERISRIGTPSKGKEVYIPPHRKREQIALKHNMENHPKPCIKENNSIGEEIIISNAFSERRWKDCENKGIYMYWNGPSKKRARLERIILKIWGDKVSSINFFAEKFWFILCQNPQDKKEILKTDFVFYKGHHVKFLPWHPNFNKDHIKKSESIIWMESIEVPSELMEEITIKKISNSLGFVIGFAENIYKSNTIRVLVKTNQTQSINRKVITNRSIYNLTFKEFSGDINKIIDLNLAKSDIKDNIKNLKKRTGKTYAREEKEIRELPRTKDYSTNKKEENISMESRTVNREEITDTGKDTEDIMEPGWKEDINYQHSLIKFKKCKECLLEKEVIEEMDQNILKLKKVMHEALLIQNDLIDQSLLAEELHMEHKGKKIKISEIGESSGNDENHTEDQRKDKELNIVRQEEKQIEKKDEQTSEILQEIQKENIEQDTIIPSADSAQWSNITIRKKGGKKRYKFWQTPNNGQDMFAPESKITDKDTREPPLSSDIEDIWWNMTMSSPIKDKSNTEEKELRSI